MLKHIRSSGMWFYIQDSEKKQQINVRLSAVRQELTGPLNDPVVVVSFGSYVTPYKDPAVPPTEADVNKCVPFVTADDDSEIIMLFELNVGINPALLFERIATVVTEVLVGQHRPMSYKSYQQYRLGLGKMANAKLHCESPASPSGLIGVWDVFFTRTFGMDRNDLFANLISQATYRAGYVSSVAHDIGSMYNFPPGFKLSRAVEGVDFLEVMSNLLAASKDNGDLALAENYLIR